jgi:hypothetical protein
MEGQEAVGTSNVSSGSETAQAMTAAVVEAPVQASEPVKSQETSAEDSPRKVAKNFREALSDSIAKKKTEMVSRPGTVPADAATVATTTPTNPTDTVEAIVAPRSMDEKNRAMFEKLPVEAKKWVLQREQETSRIGFERAERVKQQELELEPVLQHYKKYESTYLRDGIRPSDVVTRAIEWDQAFRADKNSAAREYLASYGIDPADLVLMDDAPSQYEQQSNQPVPSIDDIRAEIRNELLAEENKKHAQSLLQENMRLATEFLTATPFGKDTSSARELDEAMGPVIERLMALDPSRDKREILKEAYEHVSTKDPRFSSVRSQYEAAQKASQAKQEAGKAFLASRSISGSPSNGVSDFKPKNFREGLLRRMRGGT